MSYQDNLEQQRQVNTANWNSAVARVVRISTFLFSALGLLLGLRVLLHAFGANPDNTFVSIIYQITQPFANVFLSLLQNPQLKPGAVLELTTIIAMFVYGMIGWLVAQGIWLVFSRPR